MTPTQQNDLSTNREAIAPYNFVPLPNTVVMAETDPRTIRHDSYDLNRHTGTITCTLTTESPLYVRCALTPDDFAELAEKPFDKMTPEEQVRYAQFFYTATQIRPVIPGSTLRGMLRALVEVAGYGKMDRVSPTPLVYRAVGDTASLGRHYREQMMHEHPSKHYTPRMEAGYIEHHSDGWSIRPAQNIGGTTFARISHSRIPHNLNAWGACRNAKEIWVQVGPYELQPVRDGFLHIKCSRVIQASSKADAGFSHAVLVRSGKMPNKKSEAVVFEKDSTANLIPIPGWMLLSYQEQISKEQEALLGKEGVLQQDQPVFYLVEQGELVFFGHAMMFRIPYERTALDFVPKDLRSEKDIDLAEAIFGYVRGDKQREGQEQAVAGRVFVGDAVATEVHWLSEEPITPQILASPKPTTFQHYLVQTNEAKAQLKHYASIPGVETVVRGHKLYWHKGEQPAITMSPEQQRDVSQTVLTAFRPVDRGSSFTFTIHFENLSDVELGALLWVLRLTEDERHNGKRYRLKLGMGKPLGMGAIKLTHTVSLNDRKLRYKSLFTDDTTSWQTGDADNSTPSDTLDGYVQAFNAYVVKESGERPRDGLLLSTLRIQMLLALLRWPGPTPDITRYMEIERDVTKQPPPIESPTRYGDRTVNEYKNRRVLPTPLEVLGEKMPTVRPTQVASSPPPSAAPPPDLVLPQVGEHVAGRITGRNSDGSVKVTLAQVPRGKGVVGWLPAEYTSNLTTTRLRAKVVAHKTQEDGSVWLILEPTLAIPQKGEIVFGQIRKMNTDGTAEVRIDQVPKGTFGRLARQATQGRKSGSDLWAKVRQVRTQGDTKVQLELEIVPEP